MHCIKRRMENEVSEMLGEEERVEPLAVLTRVESWTMPDEESSYFCTFGVNRLPEKSNQRFCTNNQSRWR